MENFICLYIFMLQNCFFNTINGWFFGDTPMTKRKAPHEFCCDARHLFNDGQAEASENFIALKDGGPGWLGPYHEMGYSYEYGGFHRWWYPNSWMVHSGKSENEMGDWGVANFRKPPYSRISWLKSSTRCFESSGFHKSAPAIVSGGLWLSHAFRMLGQAGQQAILCLVISDL